MASVAMVAIPQLKLLTTVVSLTAGLMVLFVVPFDESKGDHCFSGIRRVARSIGNGVLARPVAMDQPVPDTNTTKET